MRGYIALLCIALAGCADDPKEMAARAIYEEAAKAEAAGDISRATHLYINLAVQYPETRFAEAAHEFAKRRGEFLRKLEEVKARQP